MTRHDAQALVAHSLNTAEAEQRIAAADYAFLDTFLALDAEARAARWRQLDSGAKFRLVARMLTRRLGDWTDEEVARWTAHYDTKWGSEPMPREAAVSAALERLAEENAQHARASRQASETDDARFFQRGCTAFTNALLEWRKGVRPERLSSGAYLLPSRRAGEPPHIVRMDGDWICSCRAQAQMHWPIAMVIGMEIADDDLERFDEAVEMEGAEVDPEPTFVVTTIELRTFGERIARARRALEAA